MKGASGAGKPEKSRKAGEDSGKKYAGRGGKPQKEGFKPSRSFNKKGPDDKETGFRGKGKKFGESPSNKPKPAGDEGKKFPSRKPAFKKSGDGHTPPKQGGFHRDKPAAARKPVGKKGFDEDGTIRLNKYLANAGICSRREADVLIESGAVSVNGKVVTQLGTRITREDKVQFGGETLSMEKKVYLLLNKPKGYITTVDDPQERKTVMLLVKDACSERIYPVGRLDRNTTGVLLFTNDGEITKKLTHPSHKVRKVYHVELDKGLSKADMDRLVQGIELEDGMMAVDEIAYTGNTESRKSIGVVIHSGKNRVVRRLFEALEYEVVKLDRVAFANLTKKDLPRGHWRFLEKSEINLLMMV